MKITKDQQIKQLQEEADYQKKEKENYKDRYESEKERVNNSFKSLERNQDEIRETSRQLFEIIRWLVNPSSARFPYQGILKSDEKKSDELLSNRW